MKRQLFSLLCLTALMLPAMYHSLHSQTQWKPLGPYGGTVTCLATDGKEWVYAGIQGSGVFRSHDAGRNWEPVVTGLPGNYVTACSVAPDGRVFCGEGTMLVVSEDHGDHWRTLTPIPTYSWVTQILVLPDSEIFIACSTDHVLIQSKDNGKTWLSSSLYNMWWGDICSLVQGSDHTVIIGTEGLGILEFNTHTGEIRSMNYDLPKATVGATDYPQISALAAREDGTIVAGYFNAVYGFDPQTVHWTKNATSFRSYNIYQENDSVLYGYNFAIVVLSTDFGKTWSRVPVPWDIVDAIFFVKVNGSILLSEGTGFWRSDDNSQTWNASDEGIVRTDITCGLVSPLNSLVVGTSHGGIFRSTDEGQTWTNMLFPPPGGYGDNIVAVKKNSQNTLFAASKGFTNSVWRSRTDGASWTQTAFKDSSVGLGVSFIITDLFDDAQKNLCLSGYAVSNDGLSGIFRSTNEGDTWTRVCSAPVNSGARSFLLVGDSLVVMGTSAKGFYRSIDRGSTWTPVSGSCPSEISAIIRDTASIMLAATAGSGIMRSADMGYSWETSNTGLTTSVVRSISRVADGMLFAGTDDGGFISQDHGLSWTSVTSGGLFRSVGSIFGDGNGAMYLATGTGLYKTISLLPTPVEKDGESVPPAGFQLAQNYPNPFNPSTTISFALPVRSYVLLKVYNVLGAEVATIVADALPAGSYTYRWNAAGVPSGFYIYRLQAGSFSAARRLAIVK